RCARGNRVGLRRQLVEAGELALLPGAHRVGPRAAHDIGLAAARLYDRTILVRVDLEVVFAGVFQAHRDVRRFDQDGLALAQSAHPYARRAVGEAHLYDLVVELDEAEAAFAVQVNARSADLQLRARICAYPETVVAGQGAVENCFGPFIGARGCERHLPL